MRDEKLHAIVAQSTFGSQNVESTSASDHFWKLRCRKVHAIVARSTFFSPRHTGSGPFLEVEMSKKCTLLWREAHFQVKMLKTPHVRTTFGRSDAVSRGRRKGFCTLSKVSKTWGFCSSFKSARQAWDIWRDAFRVAGAIQETCSLEILGGPGADFLRGVAFGASDLQFWEDDFAWQLQHFVRPGITFSWQAQYFRQVEWKDPKTPKTNWHEAVSSALNFPFLKEVSQNCFVFDVLNFENWGSLAELLRFWCCHLSTIEEVSQNCFVFGAAKFKHWGNLAELLRVRCCCEVKTLRKSCRLAALSMLSSLDSEQVLQVVLWS